MSNPEALALFDRCLERLRQPRDPERDPLDMVPVKVWLQLEPWAAELAPRLREVLDTELGRWFGRGDHRLSAVLLHVLHPVATEEDLPRARRAAKAADANVRHRGRLLLARLAGGEIWPELEAALRDPKADAKVRREAFHLLCQLRQPPEVVQRAAALLRPRIFDPALTKDERHQSGIAFFHLPLPEEIVGVAESLLFKDDGEPLTSDLQQQAIRGLAKTDQAERVLAWMPRLRETVRRQVFSQLRQTAETPESFRAALAPVLAEELAHGEPFRRETAAKTLAFVPADKAVPLLLERITSERRTDVVEALVASLAAHRAGPGLGAFFPDLGEIIQDQIRAALRRLKANASDDQARARLTELAACLRKRRRAGEEG